MGILFSIICFLLFVHWLADFVFQTDEMAKGKSTSNKWLLKHCGVYTVILSIFAVMLLPLDKAMYFLAFNGAAHFCTDYVTSRMTSKLYAENDIHNFFVVVGADQVIHYFTLLGSYYYLVS